MSEYKDGWYEPLKTEAPAQPAAEEKPKARKRRGWTPGRVLGVIALVMALIVGSSLLFSLGGGSEPIVVDVERDPEPSRRPNVRTDEMPEDWADFFASYYDPTESTEENIGIERVAGTGWLDEHTWLRLVIALVVMAAIYPVAVWIQRYAPWVIGRNPASRN